MMSPLIRLNSGFESVQGRRWNMEDTHLLIDDIHEKLPNFPQGKRIALYCVFDGHGGKDAAVLAEEHFYQTLFSCPEFLEGKYEDALKICFKKTDEIIINIAVQQGWRNGTTVLTILLIDNTLYIANAGDSEAIIGRKKEGKKELEAVNLTCAHRPNTELEKTSYYSSRCNC